MSTLSPEFVRALPKAELHVHIEGTLEPELRLEIARRNGRPAGFGSIDEGRASYRFTGLQSFLDLYYAGAAVLVTRRDFRDLTRDYLVRAHRDGVRHVEIFFDPQAHTGRGVPFEAVVTGIHDALQEGRRAFGITSHLIMCILRHLSAREAMATLEAALLFRRWIVGIGLDSSECGHPPVRFVEVFARARREGLRVVAHAGEEGPPQYVWQALDLLGAERIDHGVRALEDPALTERLVRQRVPLTVCPLSNVRLGIFPSMQEHNLRRLLDAGLLVTVNSDDPAYFGGYVVDNLLAAHQALGLGRAEIERLAANGFEASFLSESEKASRLEELRTFTTNAA